MLRLTSLIRHLLPLKRSLHIVSLNDCSGNADFRQTSSMLQTNFADSQHRHASSSSSTWASEKFSKWTQSLDSSDGKQRLKAVVRLRSLLFSATKRSPDDPFIPKALISRLCDEYSRLDLPARHLTLQVLVNDLSVDFESGPLKTALVSMESAISSASSSSTFSPSLFESSSSFPSSSLSQSSSAAHIRALSLASSLRSQLNPSYAALFRLIAHHHPQGIRFLVSLRQDALELLESNSSSAKASHPAIKAMSEVLRGQLADWFCVSAMTLQRITWDSPASLLERVAHYEAVHRIQSITDLKQRLGTGRRMFAFFHPNMPEVFVQVALVANLSDSIQGILENSSSMIDESQANTAIFYSITSTQPGLAGVDLGNILIKNVVKTLQASLPHITTFSTLSPIPGFRKWLLTQLAQAKTVNLPPSSPPVSSSSSSTSSSLSSSQLLRPHEQQSLMAKTGIASGEDALLQLINPPSSASPPSPSSPAAVSRRQALPSSSSQQWHLQDDQTLLKPILLRLCARYLAIERKRKLALDPVANFHLRNGAILHRINWLGDTSPKGLEQSCAMMVNYLYDLDQIEQNHQAYAQQGEVKTGPLVQQLLL